MATADPLRTLLGRLRDLPEEQFQECAGQAARAAFPFALPTFHDLLTPRARDNGRPVAVGRPIRLTPLQEQTLDVIVEVAQDRGILLPFGHSMYHHFLPWELTALADWVAECRKLARVLHRTGYPDPVRLLTPAASPHPQWPSPTFDLSLQLDNRIAQRLSWRTIAVSYLIGVEEALRVIAQCVPEADWSWARERCAHFWQRLANPVVPVSYGPPEEERALPDDEKLREAAERLRDVLDKRIAPALTEQVEPDHSEHRSFDHVIRPLSELVQWAEGFHDPPDVRSRRKIAFIDWWWRRCLGRLAFVGAPAGSFDIEPQSPVEEPQDTDDFTPGAEWKSCHPVCIIAGADAPIILTSGRSISRARLRVEADEAVPVTRPDGSHSSFVTTHWGP